MSRWRTTASALVAIGLLAACSSTPIPTESATTFDRNKPWTSDHRIERVHMSDAQKAEFVAKKLKPLWEGVRARWQKQGIDLGPQPVVALVRYTSWLEHGDVVAECLRQHGIEAQGDPNGGGVEFSGDGTPSTPANEMVTWTCFAQYPIDPEEWQEWTPEQLSMLYDYWVEWRVPCLHSYGFKTPPAPDKNEYVAKFHTEDRIWWDPASDLSGSTVADMAKKCPMFPEGFRG